MTGYHKKFIELVNDKIQTYKLIFLSGKGVPSEMDYHRGYVDGLETAKEIFNDSNK